MVLKMRTIYKYSIPVENNFSIEMPEKAQPLSVHMQKRSASTLGAR